MKGLQDITQISNTQASLKSGMGNTTPGYLVFLVLIVDSHQKRCKRFMNGINSFLGGLSTEIWIGMELMIDLIKVSLPLIRRVKNIEKMVEPN